MDCCFYALAPIKINQMLRQLIEEDHHPFLFYNIEKKKIKDDTIFIRIL